MHAEIRAGWGSDAFRVVSICIGKGRGAYNDALPIFAIHAINGWERPLKKGSEVRSVLVGVSLFLLLCFTTCTVFIQQAWALESFQIGIYVLVALYLLTGIWQPGEHVAAGLPSILVYLMPLWGVVQILAHSTASTFETRREVLRWGALAGVFFLSQVVARSEVARRTCLTIYLCFATGLAVLCLTQLFTSEGRVLWLFASGYPDVYGTFPNHNNYVQFVEVALPVSLWRAIRDGWRSWWYALCGGLLYASAIGSASRAGAIICTAELIAMLALGLLRMRKNRGVSSLRGTIGVLLLVPALAFVFTLAVGWRPVWERFQGQDQFSGRREFLIAAIGMAKANPLMGHGLGTFPEVYQQFAVRDFPFYANHAHNDWAEFAADGGIPFLLLVFLPFAAAIPTAIRHPWGVGLIAVMVHACVDYPFPRPAVSGWMYAMLGVLYMVRMTDVGRRREGVKGVGVDG